MLRPLEHVELLLDTLMRLVFVTASSGFDLNRVVGARVAFFSSNLTLLTFDSFVGKDLDDLGGEIADLRGDADRFRRRRLDSLGDGDFRRARSGVTSSSSSDAVSTNSFNLY